MIGEGTNFKNYICWNSNMVARVMDTEALQVQDHIFLATHHPVKMYRENLSDAESKIEYDEESFLKDFLRPKDFILVAVKGSAGTGKSHLVRWLKANIPETKNRRVLLIPKVGTNLKGIVKIILEGMKGEKFDEYRERLEQSTNYLSEKQARELLLDSLAMAVGPNGPHGMDNLSEEEKYHAYNLPNLLYDPHFRGYLLRDGGIIHRLTVHILGEINRVERIEDKREFSVGDLPLNVTDFMHASKKAQGCYEDLMTYPELQQQAVDWMNKNLNEAVAKVLNLNGENIMNLMNDVRESLAEQNIELVLLIEDFAKLQGIDNQLLEALLVRPNQPGRKRLCALRTAFAVTTGYFEKLMDTVRQRIEFRVNLDVGSAGKKGFVTLNDVESLLARYINAARQDDSSLREWYKQNLASGDSESIPAPSACSHNGCPHLDTCHSAFGQWEGMGLYPFTRKAIENMFERACSKQFNPRAIIDKIIKHTLENYSEHLANGEFPPPALAQHFGGPRMRAALKTKLRDMDPVNYHRRQVLLELWSTEEELGDLDPVIHSAFSLPPLGLEGIDEPLDDEEEEGEGGGGPEELFPKELEKKFRLIDEWSNGGELPQRLAGELRELVYHAVSNRIDWDSELLLANHFKGATRPFKQTSVNFIRQATLKAKTEIELLIPIDEKFSDAAVALQGLLAYNYFGNWNFREGGYHLRTYSRMVEEWAQHVLKQVKQPIESNSWSPVPAAVELLAIGARMAGLPGDSDPSEDILVASLFADISEVNLTGRSQAWKDLLGLFVKHRKELMDIVLSRASCAKGAAVNVQIIDAVQLISPIKELLSNDWQPKAVLPKELKKEDILRTLRDKTDALLSSAINNEKDRCRKWYKNVQDNIGDINSRQELINVLLQALERARDEGAFIGANPNEIKEAISGFDTPGLNMCYSAAAKIEGLNSNGQLLGEIGKTNAKIMQNVDNFINIANNFLDLSARRAKDDVDDLKGRGGRDLEIILQDISSGLEDLKSLLKQV